MAGRAAGLRLGQNGFGEPLQVDRPVDVGHEQVETPAQQVETLLGRGGVLAALALALDEEREEHVPFLGLGTQAFQVRPHLAVARGEAEGARAPLEGQPLGLQLVFAHDARTLEDG